MMERERTMFVYPVVNGAPPGDDGTLSLGSLFRVFCGALGSVGTCISTTAESGEVDG